jgi:hypothetical protein
MPERCCDEYGCTRKQPVLVRPGGFDPNRWYAITRHRRHEREGKPDLIEAQQKHVLDADTCAALSRMRDAYEAGSDAAKLREQIAAALHDSTEACARCKVCDRQIDAVMAVLADAGLIGREPPDGE